MGLILGCCHAHVISSISTMLGQLECPKEKNISGLMYSALCTSTHQIQVINFACLLYVAQNLCLFFFIGLYENGITTAV